MPITTYYTPSNASDYYKVVNTNQNSNTHNQHHHHHHKKSKHTTPDYNKINSIKEYFNDADVELYEKLLLDRASNGGFITETPLNGKILNYLHNIETLEASGNNYKNLFFCISLRESKNPNPNANNSIILLNSYKDSSRPFYYIKLKLTRCTSFLLFF